MISTVTSIADIGDMQEDAPDLYRTRPSACLRAKWLMTSIAPTIEYDCDDEMDGGKMEMEEMEEMEDESDSEISDEEDEEGEGVDVSDCFPSGLPLSPSLANTPAEELRALGPRWKFILRNPLFNFPSFPLPSLALPLSRRSLTVILNLLDM